jgi:hypothetical protein
VQELIDPAVHATVLVPPESIAMSLQAELPEMIMEDQEIVMIDVGLNLQSTSIDMCLVRKTQVPS